MTHEQKEHWLFTAKFACCSLLASSLLARLESHLTPTQPSSSLLTISIKLQYKKKVVCQPHFRFFGCSFLWPQSMLLSVSHDNHKDFLQKWILLPSSIIGTLKSTHSLCDQIFIYWNNVTFTLNLLEKYIYDRSNEFQRTKIFDKIRIFARYMTIDYY